jgi:hypothetical protein
MPLRARKEADDAGLITNVKVRARVRNEIELRCALPNVGESWRQRKPSPPATAVVPAPVAPPHPTELRACRRQPYAVSPARRCSAYLTDPLISPPMKYLPRMM